MLLYVAEFLGLGFKSAPHLLVARPPDEDNSRGVWGGAEPTQERSDGGGSDVQTTLPIW